MLKKFLLSIITALACMTATADNNVRVWFAAAGGPMEAMCRKIWANYETYFKEDTAVIVQAGLDGILSIRSLQADTSKNKVLCHGSSVWVQNQFVHSDTDIGTSDLIPLFKYSDEPTVFYTPNTNKSQSLDEMMKNFRGLNRPINVAVFTGVHRALAQYLEKKYSVDLNIVSYKRGPDFYSGLVDGSVDLAFDAGGAVGVARTGRFRIIGYGSLKDDENLLDQRNFYKDNRELEKFAMWLGLSIPKSSSPEFRELVTKRVEFILAQPDFQQFAIKNYAPVAPLKDKALVQFIDNQVKATAQIWKKVK